MSFHSDTAARRKTLSVYIQLINDKWAGLHKVLLYPSVWKLQRCRGGIIYLVYYILSEHH